jgi:amino acid permease
MITILFADLFDALGEWYYYFFDTHIGKTMMAIHIVLFMYLRVKITRKKNKLAAALAKMEVENERLKTQLDHFEKLIDE